MVRNMFQKFITATLWYDESTKLIRYGYRRPEHYLGALIFLIILLIIAIYRRKKYRETSYYNITHNSRWKVFWDKGLFGEYQIYKKLRYLEKAGAKFLFNVYLPKKDGTCTTEIDVLMLCPDGIFCFESKNYSGWIFGNERQRTWTQVLPRGRGRSKKSHFLNPILQNKGHIENLRSILQYDGIVRSLIVFSERCTFKDLTLKSPEIKVVYRDTLVYTMKEILRYEPDSLLKEEQIEEYYKILYPFTQISDSEKAEHVRNIQKMLQSDACADEEEKFVEKEVEQKESSDAIVNGEMELCPLCGGHLVKRVARSGKYAGSSFYGCSNYPKCRYIKNIDV